MAHVILINPYPRLAKGIDPVIITPPLGLGYIAAVLEKNNHRVQIIDANILEIDAERIEKHFSFKPDLIGISVNIITYKEGCLCARYLKEKYEEVPIVFGGPFASSSAEHILRKNSYIDAVIVGEGENTFLEITGSLGEREIYKEIKGVVYRSQGAIVHNESRPLIEDLDTVPLPSYHLFPPLKMYKARSRGSPVGFILTSRGCPNQCTYCNRNIFGNRWRPHSAQRVISEIFFLEKHYGVKQVDILDDNFTFDMQRAGRILEQLSTLPGKLHINLQNGININRIDDDLLLKMKRAGVFRVGFGIETVDGVLQGKIKKVCDLSKSISIIKRAKSLGMVTYGYFMLGLPGDTARSMQKTLEFSLKMDPHFANYSVCIPFPGTEVFEEVKQRGEFLVDITSGANAGFFQKNAFFKLGQTVPEDVAHYFRKSYLKFYFRPKKILEIARTLRSAAELQWFLRIIRELLKHR